MSDNTDELNEEQKNALNVCNAYHFVISDFSKFVKIGDKNYVDIKTFALFTCRSTGSVRQLISKGNKIRKLKVEYFSDKPLIPSSELIEYPFTYVGRAQNDTYYYTFNTQAMEYIKNKKFYDAKELQDE